MKRLTLTILILSAAAVFGLFAPIGKAKAVAKDTQIVQFPEKAKLLDVLLKGEYVFVHDEEKMALGDACTYIYASRAGQPGQLIASFHCRPVQRAKAERFTVVTTRLLPDLLELREYQFAGTTEGHQVPNW